MEEAAINRTLKDGTEVRLRPSRLEDFEKSLRFFQDLSEEDLLYLRLDVTDPEVVRARLKTDPFYNVFRLVVEKDDRIVADATLRWPKAGWTAHVGEARIIIAPDFRRKGLASILYRELFVQAVKLGLEKIEAHMMPQQVSARRCLEKLGFQEEGVLQGFVKDRDGMLQDLVVMSTEVTGF